MILQIETNEVINQEDEEGIEIFFFWTNVKILKLMYEWYKI
jgi:hypothetical protein